MRIGVKVAEEGELASVIQVEFECTEKDVETRN